MASNDTSPSTLGGVLNATTINLSQASGSGGSSRLITINGGTLANLVGGNLTVDSTTPVTLAGNGFFDATAGQSITINGVVQSTGNLIKTDAGTLNLPAINTYTGTTTVTAGTLNLTGTLGSAGGTAITVSPSGTFTESSAGIITGNSSFTMNAAGRTSTLSGTNTYTGMTTANAGTLLLDFSPSGAPASNILASTGSLTLGGGTLVIKGNVAGGNSQTLSSLVLASGSSSIVLNPNGSGTLTLTFTDNNLYTQ